MAQSEFSAENQVAKLEKQNNQKPKKEKKPSKVGKMLKETGSELKKVSWPTFGKTLKTTGIVLVVVAVFTVVLFGMDRLLSLLFNWFVSAI
ncbi:MAG: preprotein translocase subunit SecE [Clostridia bacterium]